MVLSYQLDLLHPYILYRQEDRDLQLVRLLLSSPCDQSNQCNQEDQVHPVDPLVRFALLLLY